MDYQRILDQLDRIDRSGQHDAVPGLDVLVHAREETLAAWMQDTLGVSFQSQAEARTYGEAMQRVYAAEPSYEIPRRALKALIIWTRQAMAAGT